MYSERYSLRGRQAHGRRRARRRASAREALVPSDRTRAGKGLTLSGRPYSALYRRSLVVPRLPFLNTCSDDSKPYMILKALDESYKNHIGFAIIRASDEEW